MENPYWDHIQRPLWKSLALSETEPYGGLYGSDGGGRKGRMVVCMSCGARVVDRGLHYRFHVQIALLLDVAAAHTRDSAKREILSTLTEDDDPPMVEVRDGLGNLIVSYPQADPDG